MRIQSFSKPKARCECSVFLAFIILNYLFKNMSRRAILLVLIIIISRMLTVVISRTRLIVSAVVATWLTSGTWHSAALFKMRVTRFYSCFSNNKNLLVVRYIFAANDGILLAIRSIWGLKTINLVFVLLLSN